MTTITNGPINMPRKPKILKPMNMEISVEREDNPIWSPMILGSIIRRIKNNTTVNIIRAKANKYSPVTTL